MEATLGQDSNWMENEWELLVLLTETKTKFYCRRLLVKQMDGYSFLRCTGSGEFVTVYWKPCNQPLQVGPPE